MSGEVQRETEAVEEARPVISRAPMPVEPDLSQVDMGCNYRGEVSQPLRHVPATLSTPADVWALGTAEGVTSAYVCSKLLRCHGNWP